MRLIFGLLLASVLCGRAQGFHEHFHTGALTPEPGSKLYFTATHLSTNGNYVLPLYADDPLYPGLFQNGATFTSLPATEDTGGPAPGHAAMGSFLEARFVSLRGPAGSRLELWQENDFGSAATPLFFINAGTTNGTNRLNISEGYVYPPTGKLDPYGHIHGRRFTLDKPGLYVVGIQLVDTGPGLDGTGPNHLPSDIFYLYLQAGVTIANIKEESHGWVLQFSTLPDVEYQLQATSDLGDTNSWTNVAAPINSADSFLRAVVDTNRTHSARFYRLKTQ